ncbi:biotin transporter BioY [Breznakiella homolactica]|uniref:Biotin transporter n=1 Tax=Breznakiella homolactica TaxID=2798577 RepID=A0A7T7XKL4_9SPIR|nr:biotin transporter BioY [Breznakiella homolactica]QQO07992.1 biotin transporter BioY [Breznakiella homolactica]
MENTTAAPAAVNPKRKAVFGLVHTALFAALIAGGTFIAIPLPFSPVPIVLQNFFALLSGLVLGPFLGAAAVALYLLAGALGAPIFAGAAGGFVQFLQPSGGFLWGYLLGAIAAGLITGCPVARRNVSRIRIAAAAVAGLLLVYIPGIIQLKFVLDIGWAGAATAGFLPFIIGDAVKGAAAVLITPRLRRIVSDQVHG